MTYVFTGDQLCAEETYSPQINFLMVKRPAASSEFYSEVILQFDGNQLRSKILYITFIVFPFDKA